MLLSGILPERLAQAVEALGEAQVYELRLRAGRPVTVNYRGRFAFLGEGGVSQRRDDAWVADKRLVEGIVYRASNYSVYAVNDQLRQGFLTLPGGARLGIAGEAVAEGDRVVTLKNITSVNIRLPHRVPGCSAAAFRLMRKREGAGVYSTLLIAPPGAGKTTFLRDIAESVWQMNPFLNTLILDERGELTAPGGGELTQFAGENVDVLYAAPKRYAFVAGIRAMRPDVVICDELGGEEDANAVRNALTMGVSVVASVHGGRLEDLAEKPGGFHRLFERYVLLSSRKGPGTLEGVYDAKLSPLYFTD